MTSFLRKIRGSSKSTVQFPEDTIRAQMKEEKRQKRSSVHGLSGFRSRQEKPISEETETAVNGQGSTAGLSADVRRSSLPQSARDRERKKHKDMSGIVAPSSGPANQYPTFLVHYLGRMPTHAEYGRDAIEKPVEQLCKLREKQKLSRIMLNFNPDGLKCWEVSSGPFIMKMKKDGFTMSAPLHHITYGVGSTEHPNIFACIIRMTDDPVPGVEQLLMLHAFVCAKPEVTQKLSYWQLQAYIEAYEDLKRKRILRDRRRQAMGGSELEMHPPPPTFTALPEEAPPKDQNKDITEVKIKGKGKVKVKTHTDSAMSREDLQNGPSKAVGLVLQDGAQASNTPLPLNNNSFLEEDDPSEVFVEASGAATGTVVHRARIVSRPRMGSSASDTGNPSPPAAMKKTRSREGSSSSEGEIAAKVDISFQKRIGDLQGFMDLDANMLKKLMVTEHPTLARRISSRASVDPEGVFHQDKVDL